jgi:hypothetical protein
MPRPTHRDRLFLEDDIARLRAENERLKACLARTEFAVTSTAGNADRSEFHRGWAACCKMVTSALGVEQ